MSERLNRAVGRMPDHQHVVVKTPLAVDVCRSRFGRSKCSFAERAKKR
jgi:hypothetical protein